MIVVLRYYLSMKEDPELTFIRTSEGDADSDAVTELLETIHDGTTKITRVYHVDPVDGEELLFDSREKRQ